MTTKSEKNARLEASNTRKREMQELEIERKKNEKPSDLEQVQGEIYLLQAYIVNIGGG